MVKRFVLFFLCLFSFSIQSFSNLFFQDGTYINESTIKDGFEQFNLWSSQEQIAFLKGLQETKNKINPDVLIAFLQEIDYQINPDILEAQINYLDAETQRASLIKLLGSYSKETEDLQDLVKATLNSITYKELFQNLSENSCNIIGNYANPKYFREIPFVDFFNYVYLPSFFQPTLKNSLINRAYYNTFKSFDQKGVWIEPYGFKYESTSSLNSLSLKTFGFTIGGEYTLTSPLVLGLGLGYSHSNMVFTSKTHGSLHTFYLGPTLSYLFPYGYLSTLILGAANFYHINRETWLSPKILHEAKIFSSDLNLQDIGEKLEEGPSLTSSAHLNSWDIGGRLEGGLSLPLKSDFYLSPIAKITYLYTFNQSGIEKLDKEIDLKINSLSESFLQSKIEVKMSREIFKQNFGFIIPHFSIGWVNNSQLKKTSSYSYSLAKCKQMSKENIPLRTRNHYFIDIGFSLFHKKSIFLVLSYQFYGGGHSTTHLGNLRLAWSF